MLYKDRKEAGLKLGEILSTEYRNLQPLVFGIPRGGAEVAVYAAKALNTAASLIVSCKLTMPGNDEYGFGAISENGELYLSPSGKMLTPDVIGATIEKSKREVERRIARYRNNAPLPDMINKTVILIDDGIATGVTMIPAVRVCRKNGAGKIVVAAPVSGIYFDENLSEVDDLVIPQRISDFQAVSQFYADFEQIPDEKLMHLLQGLHV